MAGALQPMDVTARAPGEHAPAAGAAAIERLQAAAAGLAGARVLHVSVAGGGGGVPETLGALLPLQAGTGLDVEWRVLFGGPELQEVAGALRSGLQGAETAISDGAWRSYLEACAHAAEAVTVQHDVIVLHDPAALGLVGGLSAPATAWHCHVDAARPDAPAWQRVAERAGACTAAVVADPSFGPPGLDVHTVAPGIDPLSPRNLELAPRMAGRVLRGLGLDLDRPLITQLMRLDGWKDPHTLLDAFRRVSQELPELQLVIASDLDAAGGEGWPAHKEVSDYAGDQEGVHLLTGYAGLGNLELGALNQLSRVAVRSSLREGFGLAASEAMWRGTPVVGAPSGGTALQVRDGVEGYLAEGPEELAGRITELVRDPGLAIEMGIAGRERVRERFLITRMLTDELRLLGSII